MKCIEKSINDQFPFEPEIKHQFKKKVRKIIFVRLETFVLNPHSSVKCGNWPWPPTDWFTSWARVRSVSNTLQSFLVNLRALHKPKSQGSGESTEFERSPNPHITAFQMHKKCLLALFINKDANNLLVFVLPKLVGRCLSNAFWNGTNVGVLTGQSGQSTMKTNYRKIVYLHTMIRVFHNFPRSRPTPFEGLFELRKLWNVPIAVPN